jgi:hypothetical protein
MRESTPTKQEPIRALFQLWTQGHWANVCPNPRLLPGLVLDAIPLDIRQLIAPAPSGGIGSTSHSIPDLIGLATED